MQLQADLEAAQEQRDQGRKQLEDRVRLLEQQLAGDQEQNDRSRRELEDRIQQLQVRVEEKKKKLSWIFKAHCP